MKWTAPQIMEGFRRYYEKNVSGKKNAGFYTWKAIYTHKNSGKQHKRIDEVNITVYKHMQNVDSANLGCIAVQMIANICQQQIQFMLVGKIGILNLKKTEHSQTGGESASK